MSKSVETLTQDPNARYRSQLQAPTSTAVWLLIAVITMFFFLFTVAYRIRMTLPDWQPISEPWQLAVSTVMLVMSCVTMHLCYRKAALLPSLRANHALLVWTVIFTFGFVFSQLWAWQALLEANLGVGSSPAASFFYLLTGLHGLHVLGGLIALAGSSSTLGGGITISSIRPFDFAPATGIFYCLYGCFYSAYFV